MTGIRRFCWSLAAILLIIGCSRPTPLPSPTLASPTSRPTLRAATPTPTTEIQPMITTLALWVPEEMDPYGEGPAADVLAQQLTAFSLANPNLQVEASLHTARPCSCT